MSETISSLMKKLKLSRSGVEMRMSRIPHFRAKYTEKIGKELRISDKGAKFILNNKTRHRCVTSHNTSHVTSDTSVTILKNMLQDRDSHIHDLQKQLDAVDSSNKHLGKLLDQQQQLQLTSQGEVHKLRGQIKCLEAVSGLVNKNTDNRLNNAEKSQNSSNNSKPGFWHRFFNNL